MIADMQETEILQQAAIPSIWDIIALVIGIIGAIITVISVIVTIKSMHQAERHKKDAEKFRNDAYKYKTQAAEQLRCLDMYAYAESFTRAMNDITRTPAKDNNNRAGKLCTLFDRLATVLGDITKYTTLFRDTDGKKLIETQKTAINRFIIEQRANATVDIATLSAMFEEI